MILVNMDILLNLVILVNLEIFVTLVILTNLRWFCESGDSDDSNDLVILMNLKKLVQSVIDMCI